MYTEKSVSLKSDFYTRYGETKGELYFEKTGIVCVVLDADTHKLMFPLDCCVRAYGRGYGDVLKVMDADTNVCDVHFVDGGKGAQVLYTTDIPDISGAKTTILYTVNKLLMRMGSAGRLAKEYADVALCDEYAQKGWCAVKSYGEVKSVPLPLIDYNVLLIRARKNKITDNEEKLKEFYPGEKERIRMAMAGLKECRTEVLFDAINESQKSIERLLSPSQELISVVHSTYAVDGIDATRISDYGVISFCKKQKTDSAIKRIKSECERALGYPVRISVVK
ncbi:MAG: hypothetical protein IJC09_00655 [Clostridia bacterium]|nr:hypothetical protein [Clostridia bacterium]